MQIPNFHYFLSNQYIFDKNPPVGPHFLYFSLIFVFLIVMAFLTVKLFARKEKKLPLLKTLKQKIFNVLFYSGMIGLALSFFHWQQIVYLGSHFFFLILLIIFVLWWLSIGLYYFFTLPGEVKAYQHKRNFEKYLPARNASRQRMAGGPQKQKKTSRK